MCAGRVERSVDGFGSAVCDGVNSFGRDVHDIRLGQVYVRVELSPPLLSKPTQPASQSNKQPSKQSNMQPSKQESEQKSEQERRLCDNKGKRRRRRVFFV